MAYAASVSPPFLSDIKSRFGRREHRRKHRRGRRKPAPSRSSINNERAPRQRAEFLHRPENPGRDPWRGCLTRFAPRPFGLPMRIAPHIGPTMTFGDGRTASAMLRQRRDNKRCERVVQPLLGGRTIAPCASNTLRSTGVRAVRISMVCERSFAMASSTRSTNSKKRSLSDFSR